MQYRMLAVLLCVAVLGACDTQRGIVAPRDTPPVVPDPNYACSNALSPAGAFVTLYTRDGVTVDSTPRAVNRYLFPHKSADTVVTTGTSGQHINIIFHGASASYCFTLSDSLAIHLPNAISSHPVP